MCLLSSSQAPSELGPSASVSRTQQGRPILRGWLSLQIMATTKTAELRCALMLIIKSSECSWLHVPSRPDAGTDGKWSLKGGIPHLRGRSGSPGLSTASSWSMRHLSTRALESNPGSISNVWSTCDMIKPTLEVRKEKGACCTSSKSWSMVMTTTRDLKSNHNHTTVRCIHTATHSPKKDAGNVKY